MSREHDVGRLQIAVDDAGTVYSAQRVGNLSGSRQRLVEWHRSAAQPLLHRGAVEPFRHEIGDVALVIEIVHRADVRMSERRGCPALLARTAGVGLDQPPRRLAVP